MKQRFEIWTLVMIGFFYPAILFADEAPVPSDSSLPLSADVAVPADSEKNQGLQLHGLNEAQKQALEAKRAERRLALEKRLEELKQLSKAEKDRRKLEMREERLNRKEERQERRMENPMRLEQKRERMINKEY